LHSSTNKIATFLAYEL